MLAFGTKCPSSGWGNNEEVCDIMKPVRHPLFCEITRLGCHNKNVLGVTYCVGGWVVCSKMGVFGGVDGIKYQCLTLLSKGT